MIEAEIKGKLPEVENKEDVLTSSTFGMLKYISDNNVLINILKYAKTTNGKNFYDCIDVNLLDYQAEYVFWPTLPEFGEPDLLIVFRGANGIHFYPGNIEYAEYILRNYTDHNIGIAVVTDNQGILGIGDQGAGGIPICLGKLMLSTQGAGIAPWHCYVWKHWYRKSSTVHCNWRRCEHSRTH